MDFKFIVDTQGISSDNDFDQEAIYTKKKVFTPTEEQELAKDMVSAHQVTKINAVAGSGKSSSLAYIARANPVNSLMLVFNKSMQVEAQDKFPDHVDCLTTHSLAYRHIGNQYQHKLSRPVGRYKNCAVTGTEVAMYFKLPDMDIDENSKVRNTFIGMMVKETVAKYEQSSDLVIESKHFPFKHHKDLEARFGKKVRDTVRSLVIRYAEDLWEERKDKFSPVLMTHDGYLKLYALSNPDLSKYEIMYLDEFQDTSDVVIDMVLKQKDTSKLVMVGDSRQSIYQWRGAVNALKKVNCPQSELSKSFRYGEEIAKVARAVLRGKVDVFGLESIPSKVGEDVVDYNKPYTVLFRTNMQLILYALDLIIKGEKVNINIDLKDFSNMLKSCQALYDGDMRQVKHEEIVPYETWEVLLYEAKNDGNLSRLSKIVEAGDGEETLQVLHRYKNDDTAKISLSTIHRAKGLEFDQVVLGETPSNYNNKGNFVGLSEEEENLLYVAVTRAVHALQPNKTVIECLDLYGANQRC
ncbi:helicase [Shewanella sp. phage 1/40]|uniref:DNA helicase n=1 Tax=Shewanella sp. phage 1/40 TaxID=1458860 RepID=UPI0004F8086A|nr:DNA helicase [Shewanella sp. phage 1/40]AHK11544.1 helicase [Shewanella sp. phage 1/40]